jgi:hypothetical protein
LDDIDGLYERLARDVAFLVEQKVLSDTSARPSLELPVDAASAEALAGQARGLMELPDGPLLDLQRAAERVGLLAFSQDLGGTGQDAALVEVANFGVAQINGRA